MSANLYAPVAEFKDRMSITDTERDLALDRVLQSASRWVDRMTGRRFYTNATPEVRYYTLPLSGMEPNYNVSRAYGGDYLLLDDCQSVTELATDQNGDGVHETIWTPVTDYHLEPLNAPLDGQPYTCIAKTWWTGRFSFPTWPHAVKVTGTFGYCTLANVPDNVREATMMAAEVLARPIMDLTVAGVQSYKIGSELTVLSMEARALPAVFRPLLEPYMKMLYVY